MGRGGYRVKLCTLLFRERIDDRKNYCGHSLRAVLATSAAIAGVPSPGTLPTLRYPAASEQQSYFLIME